MVRAGKHSGPIRSGNILFPLLVLAAAASPDAYGCSCVVTQSARVIPVFGDPTPPTNEELRTLTLAANTARLRITLSLNKLEYLPGEKAEARLSITNPTTERIEVWKQPPLGGYMYVSPGPLPCICGGPQQQSETEWFDPAQTVEQVFRSLPFPVEFSIPKVPGEYSLISSYAASAQFRVLPGRPRLGTIPGDQRQGAVRRSGSGSVASAATPTSAGESLEIYGGNLNYGCPPPRRLLVAGQDATILYYGETQINIRIPSGITPDPAVPVRLICGSGESNEVTIGVK